MSDTVSSGTSSLKETPVECLHCHRTRAMLPSDTHGACIRCLGPKHDLAACVHCMCQSLALRRSRAERVYY